MMEPGHPRPLDQQQPHLRLLNTLDTVAIDRRVIDGFAFQFDFQCRF